MTLNVRVGLIKKYEVTRMDGSSAVGQRNENAKYFVLAYETDPLAREALETYAKFARFSGYQKLADDLFKELYNSRDKFLEHQTNNK